VIWRSGCNRLLVRKRVLRDEPVLKKKLRAKQIRKLQEKKNISGAKLSSL
jgi:hypothetical protein